MDSSSCELIAHRCRLAQCLQKQEGGQKCIARYIETIISDCMMQSTMQKTTHFVSTENNTVLRMSILIG